MAKDSSGSFAAAGLAVTVVLLVCGALMVHAPPTPADAAVGKGLLVLGGCAAIIAAALVAHASGPAPARRPQTPSRTQAPSDWYSADS